MPVAYKGRLGGQFVNRYGKKVYKSFQERVGPRGGKYFIRGRDHHKVYHSAVKPRNLGFRGEHNELKHIRLPLLLSVCVVFSHQLRKVALTFALA